MANIAIFSYKQCVTTVTKLFIPPMYFMRLQEVEFQGLVFQEGCL